MTREELLGCLRTTAGGTPSEIAERFGFQRDDRAFRWAIERACEEGYFREEGATRSKTFKRLAPLRIARICPKCNARVFGQPDWVCRDHGEAVEQVNRPYHPRRLDGHADVQEPAGRAG